MDCVFLFGIGLVGVGTCTPRALRSTFSFTEINEGQRAGMHL